MSLLSKLSILRASHVPDTELHVHAWLQQIITTTTQASAVVSLLIGKARIEMLIINGRAKILLGQCP